MTLECREEYQTFGPFLSALQCLYPKGQNQENKNDTIIICSILRCPLIQTQWLTLTVPLSIRPYVSLSKVN
jgi:hypothetical protein